MFIKTLLFNNLMKFILCRWNQNPHYSTVPCENWPRFSVDAKTERCGRTLLCAQRAMLRACRWLQLLSGNVTVAYACKNSAGGSLNFRECSSEQQGGGAALGHTRPSAHLPWLDAHRAAAATTAATAAAAVRSTSTHRKLGNTSPDIFLQLF